MNHINSMFIDCDILGMNVLSQVQRPDVLTKLCTIHDLEPIELPPNTAFGPSESITFRNPVGTGVRTDVTYEEKRKQMIFSRLEKLKNQ